jgi:pyruvate kinase
VELPEIVKEIRANATIILAEGRIELKVAANTTEALHCRVLVGGVLRSHTGINFPTHSRSVSALSAQDKAGIRLGVETGAESLAIS